MPKSFLNENQKLADLENYADPVNKRFRLDTANDVKMLLGKIRRLTGRDEIRKAAIKIAVRKHLDISPLLDEWKDVLSNETNMSEEAQFRYIPKAERDAIPSRDFGFVRGERRLFPILDQETLDAAVKLIGRAKGLTDKDRDGVRKKIRAIAKRKKLKLPKTWLEASAEMSMCNDQVTI